MRLRILLSCFCIAFWLTATPIAAASSLPLEVAAILRSSGLPLKSFGIEVRMVESADSPPWVAVNAEQTFLLASTTKLVTSLAALDLLGRDQRWRTEAHGTGGVTDGRLAGDLVIVGGEVGLTAAELRRWFAQMRTEGLDEIAGNIVLQHVALLHETDPAQAPTTAQEQQADAPLDARSYNAGKLLVSVRPARGEKAEVTVTPRPVNIVVVNDVYMGGGQCGAWARWKSAGEIVGGPPLQLWVRGRWDASCGAEDIAFVPPQGGMRLAPELGAAPAVPVPAPRMVAALWAEAGGRLRGRVVENADPLAPRRAPGTRARWSSEVSTPLPEVMREMNKTSNNAAARSLLLALASSAANGAAALKSAQARVQLWLRTQGLADGDIRVAEGAGQLRDERGRPRALVQLLRNAWRSAGSQAFVDSLPIAGVDGTLVHRMRGGAASGHAYLKTGTLSDTRALAGYVRARSGKVYAVTAIVNHAEAAKGTPALDALIEWVASRG